MATIHTTIVVNRYMGAGSGANVIARTSNGTLYMAAAPVGNSVISDNPITVYKSVDYGHNWTVDKIFSQARTMGNSWWRVAIAVDGNDKLHLAWGSWARPVTYDVGYLSYASKPSGGTWSGITDIASYTCDA